MKKREPKVISQFKASGIHINEFEMRVRKGNLKKCLWNSLLNFLFVASILGFFVYAFKLPCNIAVVFGFVAFMSLYMGLLYLNSWVFNIGYLIMPVWIISLALLLYMIVNSGFSAILNIIFKAVDAQFNLTNIREYTEFYKNRYISITVCLCFISIILVIFTNMWVSRTKKLIYPFVFYISIVEFCVYLNDDFSYFYLGTLVCAFILYILSIQNDDKPLIYKKKYRPYNIKKKLIRLRTGEVERESNVLIALIATFSIFIITSIISLGLSKVYLMRNSAMKDKSDEIVTQVAQYGFLSLFTGVTGQTGLDNGAVSRNGMVIHDGLTDLTVDLVPFTFNEMYLPQYTATTYNSRETRWTYDPLVYNASESPMMAKIVDGYNLTKYILEVAYMYKVPGSASATMRVENYDVEDGRYGPYYNKTDAINLPAHYYNMYNYFPLDYSGSKEEEELFRMVKEIILNANDETKKKINSIVVSESDGVKVFDLLEYYFTNQKKVNSEIANAAILRNSNYTRQIREICVDNNFTSMINGNKISLSPEKELQIIDELTEFFEKNYTYSLNPGTVPYNSDPIVYFLRDNKKGYCVHFASSAVLILRALGVPARYVEGYAFGGMDYEEAVVVDDLSGQKVEDKIAFDYRNRETSSVDVPLTGILYDGYNRLNISNVVELDLTDNNAHAWVEVFIYGKGWIPFEFTVADSDEEEGDYNELLRRFMTTGQTIFDNDTLNNAEEILTGETIERVLSDGILIIFITVGIIIVFYAVFKICKKNYDLYWCKADRRVVMQYRYLVGLIKNYYKIQNKKDKEKYEYYSKLIIPHENFREFTVNEFLVPEEISDKYIKNILKFNYSGKNFNDDKLLVSEITSEFKEHKRYIKAKYSIFRRIFL